MTRRVYMLEHDGTLLFKYGVFRKFSDAKKAARDKAVIEDCKPTIFLKYFGKPMEYEQRLAEFVPPRIVRFVETR